MTSDSSRHRLGLLAVAALSLFGALFARLWFLQVVEGDTLSVEAAGNATQEVIIPADRGRILDRNGVVLVDNRPSITVGIDSQAFEELSKKRQAAVLKRLAAALNAPAISASTLEDGTTEDTTVDGTSTDGTSTDGTSTDGTSTDGTSTDGTSTEDATEGATEGATDTTSAPEVVGELDRPEVTVEDLEKRLADTRYTKFAPIPVAEDITEEQQIFFSEQADRFPSVVVQRTTVRDYPYGSLAAHVLGYVGPLSDQQWEAFQKENDPDKPYLQTDVIGKAGVEASYEQYLRGTPGRQVFEVDRSGKVVREIESERREPKAGSDLYLSIDVRVQYKAEESLQAQLLARFEGRPGAEAGGMVVLDQTNGQVRAMASYPTYNPADLVGGISCPVWRDLQGLDAEGKCGDQIAKDEKAMKEQGTPPVPKLLNRAMQGAYFPASTFKLASSYAALQLGIRTPEFTTMDNGSLKLCDNEELEGCVKQNAGGTPHGPVNLMSALTVSSDVYFYEVGRDTWASRERVGEDAMQVKVGDLGYGQKTGIDLPGESPGILPTPDSEEELAMALYDADPEYYDNDPENAKAAGRWNTGFSADLAIGQKVNATPLQTANAYATLANGGTRYQPTVMDKITAPRDPGTVEVAFEKKELGKVDFGDAYDDYLNGFRGVVNSAGPVAGGTAVRAFAGFPFDQMPLAGKTGTAENGKDPKTGLKRPDTSEFVAFTTGGTTSWTAAAVLEYSGGGSAAAAPAVRGVLEPIATGSIFQLQVPEGGTIDAEAAAEELVGTSTAGSD